MRRETETGLARGLMAFALVAVATSTLAIGPVSAQGSGSWAFDCKGKGQGSVSWHWLLDGAPITGAGGSASCSGTVDLTGMSSRPTNANGLAVSVYVTAGNKLSSKSVTKSFDASKAFKLKVSASASDRVCVQIFPEPNCIAWDNDHEGAQFSLQG